METTEKIVIGILEKLVSEDKRDRISLQADFRKNLGLDSFKLISLVFELAGKTKFDITRVSNDELKSMTTVEDIVASVNKQQEV